jgi:hypothetical protein
VVLFVPTRAVLGSWEKERRRGKGGLQDSDNGQYNSMGSTISISPLSPASTATRGLTKQGKAPKNVVGSTMRYSLSWAIECTNDQISSMFSRLVDTQLDLRDRML